MALHPDLVAEIHVREWRHSSNIEGIGYDEDSRTLEVRFKGGARYRYGDVGIDEAAPLLTEVRDPRLMPGESPGQYLSRIFVQNKEAHPFKKMTATP
ncbi:hypothetical protein LCGC14_0841430 [marine sediment metagenome]|uniref:KTSC domain-containing protein n=1 Tax=marine sediment metagenome TaxID=412755 RepID=A0A0F9RXN9_9ZZZZ